MQYVQSMYHAVASFGKHLSMLEWMTPFCSFVCEQSIFKMLVISFNLKISKYQITKQLFYLSSLYPTKDKHSGNYVRFVPYD